MSDSEDLREPTFWGQKRQDYLDWEDFFMGVALLASERSKDPNTQVGACIVSETNTIVGVGYNGFPRGCNDDEFPWSNNETFSLLDRKKLYVCHAEMNAILNKSSVDLKNCKIYVTLFPCNNCAQLIIQSGIKEIWYMSDKYAFKDETRASKKMLNAAKVKYMRFSPKRRTLTIDFHKAL